MKTRRLASLALLTALSLGIHIAEAQIPPVIPVPGVKLGLANIITLVALCLYGRRDALLVLAARVLLSALFSGSVSALLFSAAGGLLAWGVMALCRRPLGDKLLWAVSVLGAVGHNAGQLLVAAAVTGTASILWYGLALLASAIATGALTGAAAQLLLPRLKHTHTEGG